jgi:general stress protein YciG
MKRKRKSRAAQSLGSLGGKARAKNLTPERLSEIGRKAIAARWAKKRVIPSPERDVA